MWRTIRRATSPACENAPIVDVVSTAELACLDGTVGSADETALPVTDAGVLRGDGVFEVLRVYAGRPYALREHLETAADIYAVELKGRSIFAF